MSAHLHDLIRAAGAERFEAFVEFLQIDLPHQASPGIRKRRVQSELPEEESARLQTCHELTARCRSVRTDHQKTLEFEVERVTLLASAAGQMAVESLPDELVTAALGADWVDEPDPLLRALMLRLQAPRLFEQAEDAYFVDLNRSRSGYDAFESSTACRALSATDVGELESARQRLAAGCKEALGREGQLQVECFERYHAVDAHEHHQIQSNAATILHWRIFSEGSWRAVWRLLDNEVQRDRLRPVDEFQLLYDVQSGLIEVYADRKEDRLALARVFMQTVLGMPTDDMNAVPKRRYRVESLLKAPGEFKVDAQDDIVDVAVTMLKFRDDGHARNYETYYSHPDSSTRLLERIRNKGKYNAIDRRAAVISGSLCVKYRENTGKHRRLHITFGYPNRCTLKASSNLERTLMEKYLPRWNLIEGSSPSSATDAAHV